MRDRLIELMQEWGNKNTDSFPFEQVADYLLENGVIVPPCKVGDKVYCVWQYRDYFSNTEELFVEEDECQGIVVDMGEVKILPKAYGEKTERCCRLLDCCLTEEDAEKALSKLQASYKQVEEGVQE